jgi:hypothetical protein
MPQTCPRFRKTAVSTADKTDPCEPSFQCRGGRQMVNQIREKSYQESFKSSEGWSGKMSQ